MKTKNKTPKKKAVNAKPAKKGRKTKSKKQIKVVVEKTKTAVPIKVAENAIVLERRERQYKFDERLVPFYNGASSKEDNLIIREALVKLGQTDEMTELFDTLEKAGLAYDEEGKKILVNNLFSIINGFDTIGLNTIFEEDVQAIYENNLKAFNDFWAEKERIRNKEDAPGMSN